MLKHNLFLFLLLLIPLFSNSQDFNYVNYNTRDGLPGSTVYDMTQDKDGFIWFATDNGLSRYDGKNFRNFTVKDGLPDNEVLRVFADSKGRVWICTFSKEVCYYYKNRLYTAKNNDLLAKIKLKGTIQLILESKRKTIAIAAQGGRFFFVRDNDFVEQVSFEGEQESGIAISTGNLYLWKASILPGYLDAYRCNDDGKKLAISFLKTSPVIDVSKTIPIKWDSTGKILKQIKPKSPVLSSANTEKTRFFINTIDGAWLVDTIDVKYEAHFLKGKKVTKTVVDSENNYWFTTFSEGVFKLPSKEIKTFFSEGKQTDREIFSIAKLRNTMYGGGDFAKCYLIDKENKKTVMDFAKYVKISSVGLNQSRLYTMKVLSTGIIMFGFDGFLAKSEKGKITCSYIRPIKTIEEADKEHILVGTSNWMLKIRASDLAVVDTIWKERSTKVFYNDNKYYIGTLSGLYVSDKNKNAVYLGNIHHTFTRRITDIKKGGDGTLWVSSSDNGVVGLKGNTITAVLKDTNGLASNNCRTLFVHKQYLWIGTDKGLSKIDLSKKGLPVVNYSISDGLPSNVINAIHVEDSIVWVGSPAGLTYFNENKISNSSICKLNLLSIHVSGKEVNENKNFDLSYKQKDISFNYVAVSFKSGGQITYYYRLRGLHSEWRTTTETELAYQSLPPGNYTWEIYAVNKFGIKSEALIVHFTIALPFWKAWWFYTLLALLVFSGVIWFFQRRNRRTKNELEENNRTQKQFAYLEQQALQSQMNPHFIFNCLNSIQQYILTNEKVKANEYLTGFASLVRQTLDHSEKKTITIAEEAIYLKQYLEMEKLRFGDKFSYQVNIDDEVAADFTEIPALLLQPYVENSLRHGIRYKPEGVGEIVIGFSEENNYLLCSVMDNGIGRKLAARYKSEQHIEYQSKGMTLTKKRVQLLNKINNTQIEIHVNDLTDKNGKATGTEVIIKMPL